MGRETIDAVVVEATDGSMTVGAPKAGKVRWQRLVGEVLRPGSRLGLLVQGERTYDLLLPAGRTGQVDRVLVADPWSRCAYGQTLGTLVAPSEEATEALADVATLEAESGLHTVLAPTHGTFYRRPSPESPAYVDVGQTIERGATLGLVEVMKCFSPIHFDPPEGFESGTVREVIAKDGAEVPADSPLIRVEL